MSKFGEQVLDSEYKNASVSMSVSESKTVSISNLKLDVDNIGNSLNVLEKSIDKISQKYNAKNKYIGDLESKINELELKIQKTNELIKVYDDKYKDLMAKTHYIIKNSHNPDFVLPILPKL